MFHLNQDQTLVTGTPCMLSQSTLRESSLGQTLIHLTYQPIRLTFNQFRLFLPENSAYKIRSTKNNWKEPNSSTKLVDFSHRVRNIWHREIEFFFFLLIYLNWNPQITYSLIGIPLMGWPKGCFLRIREVFWIKAFQFSQQLFPLHGAPYRQF